MAPAILFQMLFLSMFLHRQMLLLILFAVVKMPKVVRPVADMIINYLLGGKVDLIKKLNKPSCKLVIQFLRFVLIANSDGPVDFEVLLEPHTLFTVIRVCMKLATILDRMLIYYELLGFLLKCYYGKNFDEASLLPELLQPITRKLSSLVKEGDEICELALELCVNGSEFLSYLIPLLPNLIKTIAHAIKGNEEDLVSVGVAILDGLIKDSGLCSALKIPCIRDVVYQVTWAALISLSVQLMIKPFVNSVFKIIFKEEQISVGLRAVENMVQSALDSDFLEPSMTNLISQLILRLMPVHYSEWESNYLNFLKTLSMAIIATFSELLNFVVTKCVAKVMCSSFYYLASRLPLLRFSELVFVYYILVALKIDETVWVFIFMNPKLFKTKTLRLPKLIQVTMVGTDHQVTASHSFLELKLTLHKLIEALVCILQEPLDIVEVICELKFMSPTMVFMNTNKFLKSFMQIMCTVMAWSLEYEKELRYANHWALPQPVVGTATQV